jgi:hypothetical protein
MAKRDTVTLTDPERVHLLTLITKGKRYPPASSVVPTRGSRQMRGRQMRRLPQHSIAASPPSRGSASVLSKKDWRPR